MKRKLSVGVVMSAKPYLCFICNETIPYKDSHSHMSKHYNDPNQYLTCRMCKTNKHISYCRFKCFRCRLCIHLHRYRFGHTKERFREHVKKYNIHERAPLVASQAVQRSCFCKFTDSETWAKPYLRSSSL